MRYNNLENKTYDKIEINRKNNLHNKGAASNSAPHEIIPSTIGTMVEGLSIYIFPFSYPPHLPFDKGGDLRGRRKKTNHSERTKIMDKKSMYSIMLMDSVVEAVDRAAYMNGTNRSNLINQILAEHLGVETPEQKISGIFDRLIRELSRSEGLTVSKEPSDFMLSLKSPLNYKYRPTIKYSVELYRTPEGNFGELRVVFRTQSRELLDKLDGFFRLWMLMEAHYIHKYFRKNAIEYEIGEGKFKRSFPVGNNTDLSDGSVLSVALGEYINGFDSAIKTYLYNDLSPDEFQKMYTTALKKNKYII